MGTCGAREGGSMDSASTIILKVEPDGYKKLIVDTNGSERHFVDFSGTDLEKVYCFPKSEDEWEKVSVDGYGRGLIWSCRFEAHIDQVLLFSKRKEDTSSSVRTG